MEVTEPADLYGLALDEFVPARDALAKALRKGGDREGADRVRALRKPSRPAWVVNRLARDEPGLVAALLEADERLRDAQAAGVAGEAGARDAMREATAARRAAVEALMTAVTGLAADPALSQAALDRVRETLQAAASHPDLADAIKGGRLTEEAPAGGEWSFADLPDPPPREAPRKRETRKPHADAAATAEAERARKAALREARKDHTARRKDLERAERALATATARQEKLEAELERAAEETEAARTRAAEARQAAEAAEATLDAL